MDGLSHRKWELEHVPADDSSLDRAGLLAPDNIHPWLNALPQPAAIIRWCGANPRFERWNELFARHFGALVQQGPGQQPRWMIELMAELSVFALSGKESRRFEVERLAPLGTEAFACSLAWISDPVPSRRRILLSAVDRTADRRIEENLRRELVSDTLTALPNRIGFGEAVEALIESHRHSADMNIGVMILDIVRFGRINEALGTMAGDELILTVAARLKAAVGGTVVLARLGGNEFSMGYIAPKATDDAVELADRLRSAISVPIRLSNLQISMNCAIGCSLAPADQADADELIRQAQTAARAAKRSDRLEIYRAGELGAAHQLLFLESRLRDALEKGDLHLQYQPIVDLFSSCVVGFEALARWNDPELGSISPNEFIPVAEESGLVVKLGRWALNEATRQLRQWDERLGGFAPVKMNVNLSSIQIVRDDVIQVVADALAQSGIDGHRLTIELTESAIVADPDNARHLLESLKRSDVTIAMDDFGTGYSNMASLQSLPIDILKIDRSFVTDMLTDPDKLAIIRAIVSLAKTLGMKTTAEGIEGAAVAAKLRELGCDLGQGYYFTRSLMADEAYDFWLSHRTPER